MLAAGLLAGAPGVRAPEAPTYYVDALAGRDEADGLSPDTAWRTIDRANRATYGPGAHENRGGKACP